MAADTVSRLLAEGRQALRQSDTAALDARLLLQESLGLSHAEIIAEGARPVAEAEASAYRRLLARRATGEPVSRILGRRDFYGRPFRVTPAVLDPRPDTETLIAAALELLPRGGRVLDLGAGSGAIIVTLLAERPDVRGVTVDASPEALEVAQDNARGLDVAERLSLLQGSWFDPVQGVFDLIVSNPPYIPSGEIAALAADVRDFDPHLALAGGADGLEAYRAIAAAGCGFLAPGGQVLVEIGAGQAAAVRAIFQSAGWQPGGSFADLAGHVRVLQFAPGPLAAVGSP